MTNGAGVPMSGMNNVITSRVPSLRFGVRASGDDYWEGTDILPTVPALFQEVFEPSVSTRFLKSFTYKTRYDYWFKTQTIDVNFLVRQGGFLAVPPPGLVGINRLFGTHVGGLDLSVEIGDE